ncbi:MAG TPA: hypothetical protein VGE13_03700 [Candidatus Saccharimonadales bacterium]
MDTTTLDTTTLNGQTDLNSLLQNSSSSLLPESFMESLGTAIMISTIISCVFLAIFLTVYIISTIRKWKVQSAVLHMQKDISEIKQHLVGAPVSSQPTNNTRNQQETTPSNDNPLIATER